MDGVIKPGQVSKWEQVKWPGKQGTQLSTERKASRLQSLCVQRQHPFFLNPPSGRQRVHRGAHWSLPPDLSAGAWLSLPMLWDKAFGSPAAASVQCRRGGIDTGISKIAESEPKIRNLEEFLSNSNFSLHCIQISSRK